MATVQRELELAARTACKCYTRTNMCCIVLLIATFFNHSENVFFLNLIAERIITNITQVSNMYQSSLRATRTQQTYLLTYLLK